MAQQTLPAEKATSSTNNLVTRNSLTSRQVNQEHEQAAEKDQGSAGEDSDLARTGPKKSPALVPRRPGPGTPRRPPCPPRARAQDRGRERSGRHARATWRLTFPDALHHQWRRENEAETVWEVSEGRGRGMRRRGRDPRRADVSGVLEERLLRARGAARERLWEQQRLGDGGRAAAGLLHRPAAHSALGPGPPRSIAPRHWCSPE
ncbi:uncharacterized protein LOC124239600 [Equus quagga]|uniref:uncharacterized protein LOC124239600 n=1 Tax=Equus quagga TaxID=89248 RepID=UPI001EE1DF24|nr:uncharacterized protein LOC124239600 [Equus quagga]